MKQNNKDYQILMKAYQSSIELVNGKKKNCVHDLNKVRLLIKQYMGLLKNETLSPEVYQKTVNKSKLLFREFLNWYLYAPKSINGDMYDRMNELMDMVGSYEAMQVAEFREKEIAGEKIRLNVLFQDPKCIRRLLETDVITVLSEALRDPRENDLFGIDTDLYITKTGNRIHKIDCPYCKNHQLYPVSRKKAENLGAMPCKCLAKRETSNEKEVLSAKEKKELNRRMIKVFVDESVRKNLFYEYDETLPETEGIYSYLICRGFLTSENEISPNNLLRERNGFSEIEKGTLNTTLDGIYDALSWIAFMLDFHGSVIIYVDNGSVVSHWEKRKSEIPINRYFSEVTIQTIPRDQNTKADRLGRDTMIVHTKNNVLTDIIDKCRRCKKTEEELAFVKEYFPKPQKQIPNLVKELSYIAGEKTWNM